MLLMRVAECRGAKFSVGGFRNLLGLKSKAPAEQPRGLVVAVQWIISSQDKRL